MKTFAVLVCSAILAIILFTCHANKSQEGGRAHALQSALAQTTVTITRGDGTSFPFNVRVAKTSEEQAQGLKSVKSLPSNEGMLFPFPNPKQAAFWMEKTLIPLDIIFILPNGEIGRIKHNAQPKDLAPIFSEDDVIAVLEIPGGVAKRYGLKRGHWVKSDALTLNR
ncbi:MAG: DUF192 domain-containing protein [Alphaproteobacteria bacterium]|nr:DUF192 domain-containing protein [Alphaproteobacteria bacterium]